jgi:hypothetical protein
VIEVEYKGRIDADEILTSKWLEQRVRADAEVTATKARSLVSKSSGRLAASIDVRVDRRGGVKKDRVTASVVASAVRSTPEPPYDYGLGREFGNSRTVAEFYLRRSLPS